MPNKANLRHLFWLFPLSLTVRMIYCFNTDNWGYGDATARLRTVAEWFETGASLPNTDWLPLFFFVIGGVIKLTGDWLWSPRLVTLLFGSLSVIPFFCLVSRAFGGRIAVISSMIFVLFPVNIVLSTMTMSEPYFLFFLLSAVYFLVRDLEKKATENLWGYGFCITACVWLRYEGWLFAAFLPLVTVYLRNDWRRGIMNLTSGVLAISCMCWVFYLLRGDPLAAIDYSDWEIRAVARIKDLRYREIFQGMPVVVLVAGLVGALLSLNKKNPRFFLAITGLFYFVSIVAKLTNDTLYPESRYLLVCNLLMVPFALGVMQSLVGALNDCLRVDAKKGLGVFTMLLFSIWFLNELKSSYSWSLYPTKFPEGFYSSVEFVNKKIPKSLVYVDETDWLQSAWVAYTRKIYSNGKNCYVSARVWDPFEPRGSKKEVLECIQEKGITHLVLFPKGVLKRNLSFSAPTEHLDRFRFDRVFEERGFQIYQISRAQ